MRGSLLGSSKKTFHDLTRVSQKEMALLLALKTGMYGCDAKGFCGLAIHLGMKLSQEGGQPHDTHKESELWLLNSTGLDVHPP